MASNQMTELEWRRAYENPPAQVWDEYEAEKARIAQLGLSPAEYERRVRELARGLGI